jgi:hypothetical protein
LTVLLAVHCGGGVADMQFCDDCDGCWNGTQLTWPRFAIAVITCRVLLFNYILRRCTIAHTGVRSANTRPTDI